MAKAESKKPNFPSKPCPKCGQPIHARLTKHVACGWVATQASAPVATKAPAKKKRGRPKKVTTPATASAGGISLADIKAVKELEAKIGADKVRQLAEVLA
jgi:hypothetical protein